MKKKYPKTVAFAPSNGENSLFEVKNKDHKPTSKTLKFNSINFGKFKPRYYHELDLLKENCN